MFEVDTENITNITNIESFLGWPSFTRVILICYTMLVVILGLCGNGIILYGSIKHQAIQMDRATVIFIQNLAFLDFLITLVYYLPKLITLCTKRWVLDKAICFITPYISAILFINEMLIVTVISSYRLWMLKKPPSVRENINTYHAKLFMLFVLFLAMCPIVGFILSSSYAFYNVYTLSCIASYYYNEEAVYAILLSIIYIVIPMLVIIITNIAILCVVAKQARTVEGRSGINQNTIIIISSICWGFILSYVPFFVILCLEVFNFNYPGWCELLKSYMLSINVIINPIIYTLTNNRFREYLMNICGLNRCVTNNISATE